MKNSTNVIIASIILGIFLIIGFIFVGKNSKDKVLTLPIKVDEYSDFQCPACNQFHSIANEIRDIEGVEFTFKHFPLTSIHDRAYQAAIASEAAREQGKFAEYHDLLFQNQPTQNESDTFEDEDFFQYAKELELDVDKFKADYVKPEIKERVDKDMADGKNIGINSTPSLIVNGERFTMIGKDGDQIVNEIKDLVEKAKVNMQSDTIDQQTTEPTDVAVTPEITQN